MALFSNFVAKVKAKVVDAVSADMQRRLAIGKQVAQERCPVDTGKLKASIGTTWDQSTLTGALYVDMYYGYFVEMGSQGRVPAFFLRAGLAAMGSTPGATAQLQFTSVPEKYHAGVKADIAKNRKLRKRIIIGHRPPRMHRKGHR